MFRRAVAWSALTIASAALTFGAVQNEKSIELPEGQGKKILETACVTCHGLDKVAEKVGLTREAWREVVQNMVRVGADLKDDQISVLADYLAANFGEGRKILETACTTCHTLDEVKKFRGFFKREDWQDVVSTMVKYGANVKEAQIPVLVDYLSTAYK